MMKPEIKAKWVAALRSGEYQQGTDYLAKQDYEGNVSYCCLGVLCEVAEVPRQLYEDGGCFDYGEDAFEQDPAVLPASLWQAIGLKDDVPFVRYRGGEHLITELNDHFRLSFNELADLIEEQL